MALRPKRQNIYVAPYPSQLRDCLVPIKRYNLQSFHQISRSFWRRCTRGRIFKIYVRSPNSTFWRWLIVITHENGGLSRPSGRGTHASCRQLAWDPARSAAGFCLAFSFISPKLKVGIDRGFPYVKKNETPIGFGVSKRSCGAKQVAVVPSYIQRIVARRCTNQILDSPPARFNTSWRSTTCPRRCADTVYAMRTRARWCLTASAAVLLQKSA